MSRAWDGNRATARTRSLLAGLLGAATVAVGVLAPSAAAADDPGAQVIGGRDATEDYTFMVSLQKQGEHFCGGSLIKPDWVVTAAHCASGQQPGEISTRIGSKDRTAGGSEAKVSQIIVHPEFDTPPGADIALLRLDHPVEQKPIPIAGGPNDPGTPTRILGWGVNCFDQQCPDLPVVLQELDTKLVDDNQCRTFDGNTELCTDSDTPNAQGCNGDSGGPQLKGRPGEWQLIGATSRDGDDDPMCATGTGIWTDVTAYADWIRQNTGG